MRDHCTSDVTVNCESKFYVQLKSLKVVVARSSLSRMTALFLLLAMLGLWVMPALAAVYDNIQQLPSTSYDFIIVGGAISRHLYVVLGLTVIQVVQEVLSSPTGCQKILSSKYYSSKQDQRRSHRLFHSDRNALIEHCNSSGMKVC